MEVSGIGMPDTDAKQMIYYNFDKLASLKPGDILFFDELPNTNPTTLNSLLTLIEDRIMMSGDKLPDVMIVAAGNYQGMSPMTPQIKRRFVWYDVKFDPIMWQEFMSDVYFMPTEVSKPLCRLIKEEEFTGYNFCTPADLDKAVEMIIHGVSTPYEDKIKHILDILITNDLGEDITDKDGNVILAKNERMPWLDCVRKGLNITVRTEKIVEETTNEILILNEKKEIVGGYKDLATFRCFYKLSDDDAFALSKGEIIPHLPAGQVLFVASFFFQKINTK